MMLRLWPWISVYCAVRIVVGESRSPNGGLSAKAPRVNRFCSLGSCIALLALSGCDKASSWLEKGGLGGLPDRVGEPGGAVSADFEALVDRSDAGVRFRRDIPYPLNLKGKLNVTTKHHKVLVVSESELGKKSERIDYRLETEMGFDKQMGSFEVSLSKVGRRILEEEEEVDQAPLAATAESGLENRATRFLLTEGGWKTARKEGATDFKALVWADALVGTVPQLMVESGAHPRVQWFSSSRYWRRGERVVLTGSSIKMLHPYDVSGRVVLIFEGEEAIDGHPCGVFSVEGDLEVHDKIELEGRLTESEIAIRSGKIWASLLYPVILREEYDAVQTISRWPTSARKGPMTKLQGRFEVTKSRAWLPQG